MIQQLALVGSSSSLHSEACNALGASDGVIHSSISQEAARLRATANNLLCRRGKIKTSNALLCFRGTKQQRVLRPKTINGSTAWCHILAEGAMTLPVTLSGGVLFAS